VVPAMVPVAIPVVAVPAVAIRIVVVPVVAIPAAITVVAVVAVVVPVVVAVVVPIVVPVVVAVVAIPVAVPGVVAGSVARRVPFEQPQRVDLEVGQVMPDQRAALVVVVISAGVVAVRVAPVPTVGDRIGRAVVVASGMAVSVIAERQVEVNAADPKDRPQRQSVSLGGGREQGEHQERRKQRRDLPDLQSLHSVHGLGPPSAGSFSTNRANPPISPQALDAT